MKTDCEDKEDHSNSLQLLPEEMERLKEVRAGWSEETRLSRLCLKMKVVEPATERIRVSTRRVAIQDED